MILNYGYGTEKDWIRNVQAADSVGFSRWRFLIPNGA